MRRLLHRIRSEQSGLTLMELIVVIAIIGILAFTITPRVLQALDDARLNSVMSIGNELHAAMERYWAAQPSPGYPDTDTDWAALRDQLSTVVGLGTPTDSNFTDFVYYVNGDLTDYCISMDAKNKDTTTVRVTPGGVEKDGASCSSF